MVLKYLMDENVDPTYTNQLRRLKPDLFVLAVGELTAPPKGTLDTDFATLYAFFVLYLGNRYIHDIPMHPRAKGKIVNPVEPS